MLTFTKQVSKGSRFNQVYIPKQFEGVIEAGDTVEVKLVKKQVNLHYSKGLRQLSEFKEKLIKELFSVLRSYKNIKNSFIVGSFLTKVIGYNDLDVVILVDKTNEKFENKLYNELVDKFNQKFHILQIQEDKFKHLLSSCPLTRAMFSNYVSDEKINLDYKRVIDKKHIRFLLMMPEDLLEVNVESKVILDNLRRLGTIERFIEGKPIRKENVDGHIKKLINAGLYEKLDKNYNISGEELKSLKDIIKTKLKRIKKQI